VNVTPRQVVTIVFGATALLVAPACAQAQEAKVDTSVSVTGAGSSFMANYIEQCKADVKKSQGVNISYQPSGSGAGRSGFISKTTDFAGSDVAFSKTELAKLKDTFVYIPLTVGGIGVMYKVPGLTDLQLSGPTLAKIFSGQIAKWNDATIAKENPKAKLPKETIRVVVRSDSSGTSSVFSAYLDAAGGGQWKKGVTSTFPVPAGVGIAQKGSDGVANYVGGNQGNFSIGFAEVSYATERKLPTVKVLNASGVAVAPTAPAVTAAIADAKANADGTLALNFVTKKADAYPISTTSYLIARTKMDAKKGPVLRAFLTYALGPCQQKAASLGYAPLPTNLVTSGTAAIAKIKA
jgi:phosphate transport system substrate-binding protein